MRWNRAFRYLWRLNAVLILVAAGAITVGVGTLLFSELQGRMAQKREAETGPLPPASGDPRLFLGQASLVQGTMVMRADLLLRQEAAASAAAVMQKRGTFSLSIPLKPRRGGCWLTTSM